MGGPWDVAAPSIVVTEAGGRFTDLENGESIALGGGLFSNGRVHGSRRSSSRVGPESLSVERHEAAGVYYC